jgi:hypothetical protein
MLVTVKREYREASRLRQVTIAKESLLIEATPDGTTPEEGQR